MEILNLSKQSVYDSSKRLTPDRITTNYLSDVMTSMESFKNSGLIVFLDIAREALDKLHQTAHQNDK